jgi:soluble lytic murein transglycosylase
VRLSPVERQLQTLARELKEQETGAAYQRLVRFAAAQGKSPAGARAALALGHYDFNQKKYVEARKWLEQAANDPLLSDYALYWMAMTNRATGANPEALVELREYRQRFPDGVMTPSVVEELARAALAVSRSEEAVATLDGYEGASSRAPLVLLLAQAREQLAESRNEPPLPAAVAYLDTMFRFPLSDEAKTAAEKIPALQAALGERFPGTPLTTQIARAEAFHEAGRWADLRNAYRELLPKLSGPARERAELRIARAGAELGAGPGVLASLELADADLDSERLYRLSQRYRVGNAESSMLATVEQAAEKYPQSVWTVEALFATGNYFWTKLDRRRASEFYRRVVALNPSGPLAHTSQWRVLWAGYMAREDVRQPMEQFLRQYPQSSYAVSALYWSGRANERAGNVPHARGFYRTAVQRFPHSYFGNRSAERLREVGLEPVNPAEMLDLYPALAPPAPLNTTVPAIAGERWERARALRTIAFDASAELELRAAYEQTRTPGLLLAIGEVAGDDGRYVIGIQIGRQLLPQIEARQFSDVPPEIWRLVYPLPYRRQIEAEARRYRLDPTLMVGLIRQESAFAADAVSRAGAMGLMQVMPSTGSQLARALRIRFSRPELLKPEYNLRLGAYYLSGLLRDHKSREYALAAYNAGETRVKEWTAGQTYEEPSEFVESIPFTETRQYVQIVLRNAGLYRQLHSSLAVAPPAPRR